MPIRNKNMKKPKGCFRCPFFKKYHDSLTCDLTNMSLFESELIKAPDWCEIEEDDTKLK